MKESKRLGISGFITDEKNERPSEAAHQIMRRYAQCFGNFHERIHRGRFLAAFNPADKNRRKTGFFSQFFLTELGSLSFVPNGFTQDAAVMRVGRHGQLKDNKRPKSAMSLTTDYACEDLVDILKETKFRRRI